MGSHPARWLPVIHDQKPLLERNLVSLINGLFFIMAAMAAHAVTVAVAAQKLDALSNHLKRGPDGAVAPGVGGGSTAMGVWPQAPFDENLTSLAQVLVGRFGLLTPDRDPEPSHFLLLLASGLVGPAAIGGDAEIGNGLAGSQVP